MNHLVIYDSINKRAPLEPYNGKVFIDVLLIPKICDLNKINYITITCNTCTFFKMPFWLLLKLSTIKIKKDYYNITISQNIFCKNDFNGFDTKKYSIFVEIDTKSFKIIQNCYYDDFKIDNFKYQFKQYDTYNLNHNNNFSLSCYNKSIPGIFIKTCEKLDYIKIVVDYNTIMNHDHILINHACQKIYNSKWIYEKRVALNYALCRVLPKDVITIIANYASYFREYLYWIPFKPKMDWGDNTFSMDNIKDIKINFNIKDGIIYVVDYNM